MLITIIATTPSPPIRYPGTQPHLRGYYSSRFIAGDTVTPVEQGNGQTGFYYDIPCTVNGSGNLVIPAFQIQTTEDGNLPTSRFTGRLYDQTGAPREVIFGGADSNAGWRIPTLMGNIVSWADLARYNAAYTLLNAAPTYATYAQVVELINLLVGRALASASGPGYLVAGLATTIPAVLTTSSTAIIAIAASDTITGNLRIENRVTGVSFDVVSDNGADSGLFYWFVFGTFSTVSPAIGYSGYSGFSGLTGVQGGSTPIIVTFNASYTPKAVDTGTLFVYTGVDAFIFFTLPDPIIEGMPDQWSCELFTYDSPLLSPSLANDHRIFLRAGSGVTMDGVLNNTGFSIVAGQSVRVTCQRVAVDSNPLNDIAQYYTTQKGFTGFINNSPDVPSLRSLGTTSLEAAAGDDVGLVDARAATAAATASTIAKRDTSASAAFGSVACTEVTISGIRVVGPQMASIADPTDAASTQARLTDLLTALRDPLFGALAPLSVPAAPSALTATTASESIIDLGWTDNATNETGVKIERKLTIGGTFAQIALVGADIVVYSDTGLAASSHYYYRVRATNSQGDSTYSNTADDTTSAQTAPAAPSSLSALAVGALARLTWTDNSTNETSFRIERKVTGVGSFVEITSVGAGIVTYDDTTVVSGTSYDYRVRARNGAGDSAYSNTATVVTSGALNAPSGVTANYVATATTVTWIDNSTGETGFHIYRKTGAGTFYLIGETLASPFVDNTGFAESTSYTYMIRAFDAQSESVDSTNTPSIATGVTTAIATTDGAIVGILLADINVETGVVGPVDGDTISTVIDSAPAGNNLIQSNGAQRNPMFKTVGGANGKSYIRNNAVYPAVNDLTALNFTTPVSCRTVFMVIRHDTNIQDTANAIGLTGDGNAWGGAFYVNDGGLFEREYHQGPNPINPALKDKSFNAAGLLNGTTRINGHVYPVKWAPKPGIWTLFTFELSAAVSIDTVLNNALLPIAGTWHGDLARITAYSGVLTQAQRAGVEKTLLAYYGITTSGPMVIFDGDSITASIAGITESNAGLAFTYPQQTITQLNAVAARWDWVMTGVGFQPLQDMLDDFDTEILPLLVDENRQKRVVVVQGGGNDLGFIDSGLSVSVKANIIYQRFVTYAAKVHAAGAKIVVCTMLPSNPTYTSFDSIGGLAEFEAVRQAVNALLRADVTNFDGLADNGSNSGPLGCPTCANSTTPGAPVPNYPPVLAFPYANPYYIDGTHPKGPGGTVVAWTGNGNVVMGTNVSNALLLL